MHGNTIKTFVFIVLLLFCFSMMEVGIISQHKKSLENIVGHPVSWWDAYWTK